ncbi:MAG: alpha/beta hydrolase [Pseudomonadota bacterium]|nr:alpha/beta hydrolase [Pseudomonadota bacterium]
MTKGSEVDTPQAGVGVEALQGAFDGPTSPKRYRGRALLNREWRDSAPARGTMILSLLLGWTCVSSPSARAVTSPSEWHWASIHDHKIYYAVRGNGPTLVFLHGGGDSSENSFARQLTVFSQHHHIVAPDQVGQGHTPDVQGPLSYTSMMQDTAALLQRLGLEHVDVVGFSDGGILALMLAVRHPELVRRLVISGVNIAPEGLNPDDLEELRASQIPKPKTIDEKLARLWLTSPTETELSLPLLSTITQPVLVISGDRDAITLEHTLKIFHALRKAELCVLPGTDHATFSGRPDWLNPIISAFLDRTEDSAASPTAPRVQNDCCAKLVRHGEQPRSSARSRASSHGMGHG